MVKCLYCKKEFSPDPSGVRRGGGKFCSRACYSSNRAKGSFEKACLICGKKFKTVLSRIKLGHGKYCSKSCAMKSRLGERHPRWGGGRYVVERGYIEIYRPGHPRSNSKGHVREHVLVAEKSLGRYLAKEEIIHHINHKASDNRLENLYLFKDHSAHITYHRGVQLKRRDPITKSNLIVAV